MTGQSGEQVLPISAIARLPREAGQRREQLIDGGIARGHSVILHGSIVDQNITGFFFAIGQIAPAPPLGWVVVKFGVQRVGANLRIV